ncbi:hypothetical protein [Halocella sp. SP3-1]|uniref:hypothetical protein n=1 Tax=Halocella sp. SP3-1 TaxID=2382161 RepID=UPI000F751A9B|nr:hypothetical protein [Halocella sp. SP3-1]AZO95319.1 hypothetical protein D7D81_12335 [Halocella sp. SP3-1]
MLNKNWIMILNKKADNDVPSSIRITREGRVFIDAQEYDDNDPRYRNFSISVEKDSDINMGEDTRRLLELQKNSKPGERKIAKDIADKNKKEQTIVKF